MLSPLISYSLFTFSALSHSTITSVLKKFFWDFQEAEVSWLHIGWSSCIVWVLAWPSCFCFPPLFETRRSVLTAEVAHSHCDSVPSVCYSLDSRCHCCITQDGILCWEILTSILCQALCSTGNLCGFYFLFLKLGLTSFFQVAETIH